MSPSMTVSRELPYLPPLRGADVRTRCRRFEYNLHRGMEEPRLRGVQCRADSGANAARVRRHVPRRDRLWWRARASRLLLQRCVSTAPTGHRESVAMCASRGHHADCHAAGTAVYVYGWTVSTTEQPSIKNQDMTFLIDSAQAGEFKHSPGPENEFDLLFFKQDGLPSGLHTLTIVVNPPSLTLLDYIVFTYVSCPGRIWGSCTFPVNQLARTRCSLIGEAGCMVS